jgi:hypothetical protein
VSIRVHPWFHWPHGDEGDNKLRSSIAIAHGCLFIRTGSKLYCVGNKLERSQSN